MKKFKYKLFLFIVLLFFIGFGNVKAECYHYCYNGDCRYQKTNPLIENHFVCLNQSLFGVYIAAIEENGKYYYYFPPSDEVSCLGCLPVDWTNCYNILENNGVIVEVEENDKLCEESKTDDKSDNKDEKKEDVYDDGTKKTPYIDDEDRGNYDEDNVVSCGNKLLEDVPAILPKILSVVYSLLQIAVPIIIVILGSIDFIKAITSQKEEEIKKSQAILIKRLITGILIFFVFSIVKLVVSFANSDSNRNIDNIFDCVSCLIDNDDHCVKGD